MSYRLTATGLILSAILAVACGAGPDPADRSGSSVSWSREPEMMALEILVDLLSAREGRIPVQVIASGGRPTRFAIQSAWTDGYSIHELRFTDRAGQALSHEEQRGGFRVQRTEDDVVKADYVVQLGGGVDTGNGEPVTRAFWQRAGLPGEAPSPRIRIGTSNRPGEGRRA